MILLGGISYAGGVYYSLLSDNFHDFFTEYVPYGEEAVLYFEEREYRKRFPSLTNPSNRPDPNSENRITIPSKSGVSWKVAGKEHQGSDVTTKGAHMSATDISKTKVENAKQNPSTATGAEKKAAVEKAKKESKPLSPSPKKPESQAKSAASAKSAPSIKPTVEDKPTPKESPKVEATPVITAKAVESKKDQSLRPPEVNEPSRIMPIKPIDPLKIDHATEPLVQDLVKILNDIITVVNSDNAAQKYSSTITKAKTALYSTGARILALKSASETAAAAEIKATQEEFDNAARELVRRLEAELEAHQTAHATALETARADLIADYSTRLAAATTAAQDLSSEKLRNKLLQQSLALKTSFHNSLTHLVDTERNARLANLSALADSLAALSSLTTSQSALLTTTQKTQNLSIALSALRAHLESADRPLPFTHYLAALKDLAPDDAVITAAISSVNPTAYQHGVPTSAQLLDRFRRVAAEVRKAALLPANAGVASHAASYVLSGVMFKKSGMPTYADPAREESSNGNGSGAGAGQAGEDDDVEGVLARAGTLLEEGRLDEAAREMNALKGWAGVLSYDWLAEVRRVLEVRMAVEVMGAEVRLEGLKAQAGV